MPPHQNPHTSTSPRNRNRNQNRRPRNRRPRQVIKLSDAVQKLPRQVTCNVHGVGSNFLAVGRQRRAATAEEYGGRRFSKARRARGV